MAGDVVVVVDERAVGQLLQSREMREGLLEAARPGVGRARAAAPKLSGEGAASIHAEAVLDGPEWTVRVSWDQLHRYMFFQHQGTRFLPGRPFLVDAFEEGV